MGISDRLLLGFNGRQQHVIPTSSHAINVLWWLPRSWKAS